MALAYPANTIWYLEAASTDGVEKSQGSAVAIRLQATDDPSTARTYLLTCAHVVRGTSADGKPGFGPALPRIRAWPPDVGFNDRGAKATQLKSGIQGPLVTDVAVADRMNAADDWVVLEILDGQSSTAAPTVREWATAEPTEAVRICGYPGGDDSFPQGKVLPIMTPDTFPFRDEFHGALRLTGDGTRPGISGGGVFTENSWQFVGIHRSREDRTLNLHAVSARTIRARLLELGYEVVDPPPDRARSLAQRWRALGLAAKLAVIGICMVALAAMVVVAADRWMPNPRQLLDGERVDVASPAPLASLYQAKHSAGMGSLVESVGEIADSNRNGEVFVSKPLDHPPKRPIVEVEVKYDNGDRVKDQDDQVDVHWLAPDANREEMERWQIRVHLQNGVANVPYDGVVPNGAIVAVVYHYSGYRQASPRLYVWLK